MAIDITPFRVREGETIELKHRPTDVAPLYETHEHHASLLADNVGELDQLQQLLYAADSHALLLIFQAMDAAGKDGAIRHVMSGVNPQGCDVTSYKHPSAQELLHDFLWRCCRDLPARGKIGIFNRSYYEEVLIVRVHPEILQGEGLADMPRHLGKVWRHRYRSINALERHLDENGTKVVKFFLHLSKDEQRRRFLDRIEQAKKNWKFSVADIKERAFWDDYMVAYEDCLSATSTDRAPWYIVPADDKRNARLIVARVIVETLKAMKLRYPKTDKARHAELEAIRAELLKEKG
jgi:PPK2 family polyphosphate:nucleotide phosphotransferase